MKETSFRKYVTKNLSGFVTNIEDKFQAGIPDIHVVFPDGNSCWIELKVFEWSVRASTKTNFGLRPEQAIWLNNYQLSNGSTHLLIKEIRTKEYILFSDTDWFKLFKKITRHESRSIANCQSTDFKDIIKCLTKKKTNL